MKIMRKAYNNKQNIQFSFKNSTFILYSPSLSLVYSSSHHHLDSYHVNPHSSPLLKPLLISYIFFSFVLHHEMFFFCKQYIIQNKDTLLRNMFDNKGTHLQRNYEMTYLMGKLLKSLYYILWL